MSPAYKRWYDHDPKLLEVIELLKNYQEELKEHEKYEPAFAEELLVNLEEVFVYSGGGEAIEK